jgi:acyl-CoA thioesterase FadM
MLGIAPSGVMQQIEDAVNSWLKEKGIEGTVIGERWGTLTIETGAEHLHQVTWEKDNMIRVANKAAGRDIIQKIRIRTQGEGK